MSDKSSGGGDARDEKMLELLQRRMKSRALGYRDEGKSEELAKAKRVYEARTAGVFSEEALAAGWTFIGVINSPSPEELAERYRQAVLSRVTGRWLMPEPPDPLVGPTTIGTSLMLKIARDSIDPVARAANSLILASADEIVTQAESVLERDPDNADAHLRLYFAYLETGDIRGFEHIAAAARRIPDVAERIESWRGGRPAEPPGGAERGGDG